MWHPLWLRCEPFVNGSSRGVSPRDFSYHGMGIMIPRTFKGAQGLGMPMHTLSK
jgi:hypothetical protein